MSAAMLKPNARNLDLPLEAAPTFPTDADIEAAERLRHRIERRYLAAPAAASAAVDRTAEEAIATS